MSVTPVLKFDYFEGLSHSPHHTPQGSGSPNTEQKQIKLLQTEQYLTELPRQEFQ